MKELTRDDYKEIVQKLLRSVSFRTDLIIDYGVKDEETFIQTSIETLERLSGKKIVDFYKIKATELKAIFLDTSCWCFPDYYFYIFVFNDIRDDSNLMPNGFSGLANAMLNVIYHTEIENYNNSEQMLYECSELFIYTQAQLEQNGYGIETIVSLVGQYFDSLLDEMNSKDFKPITTREEEVEWPEMEIENLLLSEKEYLKQCINPLTTAGYPIGLLECLPQ